MFCIDQVDVRGEDNSHDDAVDSHDLAEDDRDQILRSYSRRLDPTTDNG